MNSACVSLLRDPLSRRCGSRLPACIQKGRRFVPLPGCVCYPAVSPVGPRGVLRSPEPETALQPPARGPRCPARSEGTLAEHLGLLLVLPCVLRKPWGSRGCVAVPLAGGWGGTCRGPHGRQPRAPGLPAQSTTNWMLRRPFSRRLERKPRWGGAALGGSFFLCSFWGCWRSSELLGWELSPPASAACSLSLLPKDTRHD